MSKVAELLNQSSIVETKSNDTIRLWEGHREQATLWRALCLLQIPATLTALIFAFVVWNSRTITLNVPSKPLPGIYAAQEIPDSEFIDQSMTYINLISTYQPSIVRRQFQEARKMIWGEILDVFDEEMIDRELKAIESTARTQIFFADPSKTKIERAGRQVKVQISGDRLKRVGKNDLPLVPTTFNVTLTTIPRNTFNPYGIVITDVQIDAGKKKRK